MPLQIESAADAYEKVVKSAGDSPHRDSVDQRLIADVKSLGKEGKTIHDPAEVGGFGEIQGGKAIPIPAGDVGKYLNDLAGDGK